MSVGPVLSILRWDRAEEERGGAGTFRVSSQDDIRMWVTRHLAVDDARMDDVL